MSTTTEMAAKYKIRALGHGEFWLISAIIMIFKHRRSRFELLRTCINCSYCQNKIPVAKLWEFTGDAGPKMTCCCLTKNRPTWCLEKSCIIRFKNIPLKFKVWHYMQTITPFSNHTARRLTNISIFVVLSRRNKETL